MCLVIVTVRLLAWGTLTLISATTIYASLTTPQWLVGPPTRIRKNQSHSPSALQPSVVDDFIRHNDRSIYKPQLPVTYLTIMLLTSLQTVNSINHLWEFTIDAFGHRCTRLCTVPRSLVESTKVITFPRHGKQHLSSFLPVSAC